MHVKQSGLLFSLPLVLDVTGLVCEIVPLTARCMSGGSSVCIGLSLYNVGKPFGRIRRG